MAINKELLDILVCPQCRQKVHLNDQGDGLICSHCRVQYPIQDDIPRMLPEYAKKLA
ncbi:MAG: Trm112 family protein [Desulfobacca sp.]|uniref:Trm112 family protein n=1 Tax=Desulfobacca sp. TaxID=2067990 RepID=UPI00404AEB4B